jgi:hypothetical protein
VGGGVGGVGGVGGIGVRQENTPSMRVILERVDLL